MLTTQGFKGQEVAYLILRDPLPLGNVHLCPSLTLLWQVEWTLLEVRRQESAMLKERHITDQYP